MLSILRYLASTPVLSDNDQADKERANVSGYGSTDNKIKTGDVELQPSLQDNDKYVVHRKFHFKELEHSMTFYHVFP